MPVALLMPPINSLLDRAEAQVAGASNICVSTTFITAVTTVRGTTI